MEFEAEYERCRVMVEGALAACFTEQVPQKRLLEAMRYSLLAGGKRIRPVLALQFCKMVCGAAEPALPYACGIEMLHTYSLIHDDLPCMDNDDLRRGKPSCHKKFGEYTAVLSGDALQASAFHMLASAEGQTAQSRANACAVLSAAAGSLGMCGGQQLDMEGEGTSLTRAEVDAIHMGKTAALLEGACVLGLPAGGIPLGDKRVDAAHRYGAALGMAFQIRDDILNATADIEALGKPIGSDATRGKCTYVTLLGLPACARLVEEKTEEAKAVLSDTFQNPEFLTQLADALAQRIR